MITSEWVKSRLLGAAVGALALSVVGFSWGGWMTGGGAKAMASDMAREEVVSALVPICVELSKRAPQDTVTLAKLKDTASYQRDEVLMAAGWATMPGAERPDRRVAEACMEKLASQF